MRQAGTVLIVPTRRQGLVEITAEVRRWSAGTGIATGLLTLFCRHTSASLTVQENADPDVRDDLETFFKLLVREDPSLYTHTLEGPDDMPAHIRSALTLTSLSIPVVGGAPLLGTWQGIYLFEHRASPHRREIALQILGD